MKGFDVLHVKSAVKNHNKFDLSRTHLTTAKFGEIIPLLAEETVPGDKFNIGAEYFSRMAPMVVPTYGKFSFKTVAGFVPYHQLAVDAEAWLAGKTTWEGQTPVQRWFSVQSLHSFIVTYCIDPNITPAPGANNEDYCYTDSAGTFKKCVFTAAGKYWVKVLNALGYALPQGVDLQTGSNWLTSVATVRLSAYPLLAFAKMYNDYMSQSQRFNTSNLSDLLNRIKYKNAYSGFWNNTTGELYSATLNNIFSYLLLNYENDYFTSAWQNANAALSATESISSVVVPNGLLTGSNAQLTSNQHVDTTSLNVSGGLGYVSQRALDFLKSFDDWVRRNNYSGSRAVQQVYSRFGIKTDEFKSHYAHIISTDTMPIQVGDVTSTADAGNAILGDYAGKGIMSGSKGISCNVDDYGVILILGYFTVVPMNAYGSDRKVLRSTPLEYYNPEFDGLGAQAITLGETFASPIVNSSSDSTLDTAVFGYTERYNEYRYGRDQITGDFRNYHDSPMNAWHTGRDLSAIRKAGNLVAQSSSMNTLPQTNSEYQRIFNITSGPEDYFYLTCRFNVDAVRPMLNLNQVVKLGEGDTRVPRNGNVIS